MSRRKSTKEIYLSCEDLFKDADEVIMISLKTEGEAREAEKYLIRELLPRYNRVREGRGGYAGHSNPVR